jgi:[ribosomal protein S5]-alanine N-acetyltransferase
MTEPAMLRAWSPDDGAWYVAQLPDSEIQRFTTELVTTTADDFRAALNELGKRDDHAGFAIVDAESGELAGNIAADRVNEHTAEVSYWVAPGFRGRGLASSALRSMVAWLAGHWHVLEVALWTHAENIGSQRTAERAGFRYRPERDEMRPVGDQTWPARWYTWAARRARTD